MAALIPLRSDVTTAQVRRRARHTLESKSRAARTVANVRRTAILVAGMHRSGTSALTRVVSLLGARLPEVLVPAGPESNERGYWESLELYRLHEQLLQATGSSWDDVSAFPAFWFQSHQAISFRAALTAFLRDNFATASLFVIKDPRVCRFLPLWLSVLDEFDAEPKVIIPIRNPLEVAKSLAVRDGFPVQKSCLLWLRHSLDTEIHSRGISRSFVRYEDLISDWRRAASLISKDLSLPWPVDLQAAASDIEAFLDGSLHHHRASLEDLHARSDIVDWVSRAYGAALMLCKESSSIVARQTIDAIRADLDKADLAFKPVLADELGRAKGMEAELREQLQVWRDQVQVLRDEQQLWRDQVQALRDQVQALRDEQQLWRDQVQALRDERSRRWSVFAKLKRAWVRFVGGRGSTRERRLE
jgi:hypothetical protein